MKYKLNKATFIDYMFYKSNSASSPYFNLMDMVKPLSDSVNFNNYAGQDNKNKLINVLKDIYIDVRGIIRMKYFSEYGWQFNSYYYHVNDQGYIFQSSSVNFFAYYVSSEYQLSPYDLTGDVSADSIYPEQMLQNNNTNFHSPNVGDVCYVISVYSQSTTDVFKRLKYQDGGESGLNNFFPNNENYIQGGSPFDT